MTIGEHINITRRKALITVEQLSKITNLSMPTIRNVENGKNTKIDTLETICDALDRDLRVVMVKRRNKVNQ